ncbi:hypothetical protein BDW75DRAFT_243330 [Aspergillus navahoensis]
MTAISTKDSPGIGVSGRNVIESFSLKERTIVITGVTGGLGINFANACVQAGANVAGIDIASAPHADFHKLSAYGTKVSYYQADVTDAQLVEDTFQQIVGDFKEIHGCITCAGIAGEAPFHEYPAEQVRKIVNVNLLGSFFVAQSAVRQLLKQKTRGSIVFISSVASHQANASHPVSAYGATKYAVRGLAQQVAVEYAPYGIRANSITPGPMLTDMSRRLAAGNPDVFKNLCSHIMLNRMGEPDELNGAAVFLLSDASSFVTAEDILVDGGQGHL